VASDGGEVEVLAVTRAALSQGDEVARPELELPQDLVRVLGVEAWGLARTAASSGARKESLTPAARFPKKLTTSGGSSAHSGCGV
jgi:hypothetical protein